MTDRERPVGLTRTRLVFALAALAALGGSERLSRGDDVSPLEVVGGDAQPDVAAATLPTTARAGDELLLISTRGMGTRCDAAAMATGLHCERRDADGRWTTIAWSEVVECFNTPIPTVLYVHGNRVPSGADKSHGLAFYRWLEARRDATTPLRYVIWSWPSAQVRGRIKDYEVKAARCRPCGWQLAWAIDQLPVDAPLAIVGYSYGARLTTGALHLLGGGTLGGLELAERLHPDRPRLRVALVAAAMDADWLRPGGFHDRAMSQVESLLTVNNQLDPAMRFYPMSPVGNRASALGYAGPVGLSASGVRIRSVDTTSAVGRHHDLGAYLSSSSMASAALLQAVAAPLAAPADMPSAPLSGPSLAERDAASGPQ